ncbi:MAG: hypothetical protein ACN4G0_05500 [Polyangiales bacterium]
MFRVLAVSTVVALCLSATPARAQQGTSTVVQTAPGESAVVITGSPASTTVVPGYTQPVPGYGSDALQDANDGIRRTRNALIATSALAAVGMIVGATAFRHCDFFENYYNYYNSQLVCTDRGERLLTAGGTIFGLAAIGVITSGIMLGVRKGKRRRLRRDIQRQSYGARLQWNTESGRLEF